MPERASGVGRVYEDAAEVPRGEHGVENFELTTGRLFVRVGGGEVGVDSDQL
jgi:hypothetical protein